MIDDVMKKPPHRPLIPINWEQVEKMCAIQCTGEEIAGVLNIDYDTLQNACKREQNCTFSEYIKQKKSNGRMSLRRKQYSIAMDGNATMLIWLGKNWLGQSDKLEADVQEIPAINIIVDSRAINSSAE